MRGQLWIYPALLPLTPPACGNSPYSSFTAFGGNPLLIDPDGFSSTLSDYVT